MADLGVLPSKTGITITSSNGENGTLPGATPSAAGCMTAEHARQLSALWSEHETSGGTVIIERPAPRSDAVTRDELRSVVSTLQRSIVPLQPAPPSADIDARLSELERREMDLALRTQQLLEAFDEMARLIDERLVALESKTAFIEANALARVEARAA